MLSTVDINTESESVLISSSDHRWGLEFDTSHVNEEHQRALATALRHKCWTRNHAEPPLPPQQRTDFLKNKLTHTEIIFVFHSQHGIHVYLSSQFR